MLTSFLVEHVMTAEYSHITKKENNKMLGLYQNGEYHTILSKLNK